MQKRMHSREFKLEVVREIVSGQKRPAQACREYGLADSVLSRWRKEYQERGEAAFQSIVEGSATPLEQRVAELERCCGQLALENAVLKKHFSTWKHGKTRDDHHRSSRASRTGCAGAV